MDVDTQHQLRQLQQQLAAREQEVAALREIAEAAAQLQSQDVQAAKVLELSKKNRALNLSFEKEKHKVAKLQQALSEATAGKAAASVQQADGKQNEAHDAIVKELAAAKEKHTHMTNKIGTFEQKVFMLETENKKLARALQREVGDELPLQKVIDEGTDWKGRREQIVHLKDTIRHLKESAGATTVPSSLAKHETQHKGNIEKMNKERAAEMDRMQAELTDAKKAAEQLKLQYAGASSRRKVLEDELASMKDKLSVVLNKTKNDDKLIVALRSELSLAAKGKVGAVAGSGGGSEGLTELYELRSRCIQLEEQVEQQQKVIRYLQANGSSSANGRMEQLKDENQELKQQLESMQSDLEEASNQRPGTSGMSSALRQQVAALQDENNKLRAEIFSRAQSAAAKSPKIHLTSAQQHILQEAQEALSSPGVAAEIVDVLTDDTQ